MAARIFDAVTGGLGTFLENTGKFVQGDTLDKGIIQKVTNIFFSIIVCIYTAPLFLAKTVLVTGVELIEKISSGVKNLGVKAKNKVSEIGKIFQRSQPLCPNCKAALAGAPQQEGLNKKERY